MSDNLKIAQTKPTKEQINNNVPATISLQGKDFFIVEQFAGGQQVIALSASPLNVGATESSITFNETFKPSFESEFSLSLSQRIKGILPYFEVVDTDEYTETFQEFNIVASYVNSFGTTVTTGQTATTLTICLDNPFDGQLGYWVDVYGLVDNRFNYTNLNVSSISADKKALTLTYSDDYSLPSLTANPSSVIGGKLKCQSLSSNNFARLKFSGTYATPVALQTRFNSGKIKATNTINTGHTTTTGTTASSLVGTTGNFEIKPSTRFKFFQNEDVFKFNDAAIDINNADNNRVTFTEVKPSFFKNYRNRMRMVNPISAATPVAEIVKAEKLTASTTATITTGTPHGLVTGNYIVIKGIRDSTNFANITTPTQVTVLTSTTFTATIGTAVIATSYGGIVAIANGNVDLQGFQTPLVQTITRTSDGLVVISGSSSWTVGLGEYVDLVGCRNATTGADLGLNGIYRVNNVATTTLTLEPVTNLNGTLTTCGDGSFATPATAIVNAATCCGAIILRQTMRLYDIKTISYTPSIVRQENQGIGRDESMANPVVLAGTSNIVTQGTPATISTTSATGAWFVRPAIGAITDITSAAITTTTTSSTITNDLGNAFQVTIPVTAIAGTNPTLDIRIEESFDGGTNWHTLYDFERITATGIVKSPMLRANGRHIRYVQTVTGTTPSFTRAIIRNVFPSHTADKIARLIDRTIVPTTLASSTPALFAGSASNVQLVINLGVTTTPPVLKLQGSEDGTNWYNLSETTLTGVASSTVQLTLNNINAPYVRATVATVGASVTLGYVAIKAWA